MKLKQYMNDSGSTQESFSKLIGHSKGYVSQLVNGKKQPSLDLAFKIERLTNNAVPADSWVQQEGSAA